MHADLMRAAGFQTAAHDGPERILKDSLVVCSSPQAVPFFTDTHFSDTFPRRIERIRVISWNLLHGKTNGFFLRKRDGVPEPGILFSARRSPAAGTVWQQPADSLQIVPDPMYLCQDGRCSGVQKALSVFLTGMRQHVSGNRNNGRGKRGRSLSS